VTKEQSDPPMTSKQRRDHYHSVMFERRHLFTSDS
jgi:hypothetical protein